MGAGRHDRLRDHRFQYGAAPHYRRGRAADRPDHARYRARARGSSLPIHPARRPSRAVHHQVVERRVETAQVAVLDLTTGRTTTLIRGGSQAEYVDPSTLDGLGQRAGSGYLVYAVAGTLRAVRFDPVTLDVGSDPVLVVEAVTTKGSGAAEFSVSRTGALVYVPGGGAARAVARVGHAGRPRGARGGRTAARLPAAAPLARRHAGGARHSRSAGRHLDLGSRAPDADPVDGYACRRGEPGVDAGQPACPVCVVARGRLQHLRAGGQQHGDGRAPDHESE